MNFVRLFLLVILLASNINTIFASIFPINIFRPWDINLEQDYWCGVNKQLMFYAEHGFEPRSYNGTHHKVSLMDIWQPTQNAIAMLEGFPLNSPETDFLINVLDDPTDNGIRGHFRVNGEFDLPLSAGFAARFFLPHDFIINFYLPFYSMRLHNVQFTDLTPQQTVEDIIVKEELTSQLNTRLAQFDPSLNITGWNRTGIGDFTSLVEWKRDYYQGRTYLKNVQLLGRFGVTFPVGLKKNEDDILSIPFGFDGSFGMIFGGGIQLNWFGHLRGGFEVEFWNLFGNTRNRRIKIQQEQTDFLFLAKAQAHKDFGFTQVFNLYLQAYRICRGLSVCAIYQYMKHGDDKLALGTNEFSPMVINSAESLQEWTMHQLILKGDYDMQCDLSNCAWLKPQFSFWFKFPFNGKRALMLTMVGGSITFNF